MKQFDPLETVSYISKKTVLDSLIIMEGDRLIYEGYFNGFSKEKLHRLFSVTKTMTAIAVSSLEKEGLIHLDDPIIKYFTQFTPRNVDKRIAEMTIADCLAMKTCYIKTTYDKKSNTKDWVESFFIANPDKDPGTLFNYDTSSAHVLAALVENISGRSLLDYLKEKILCFTGFSEDSYIVKDPFGVSMGGSGLVGTSRDLLILTRLLSEGGSYICTDGIKRCLINPSFLMHATQFLTDTRLTANKSLLSMGYGDMVWHEKHGGYFLYGMGGQFGFSFPLRSGENLYVITTADTQGNAAGDEQIYEAICEQVLPHFNLEEKRTVPENRDPAPFLKIMSENISYKLEENPYWSELSFSFDKEEKQGFLHLRAKDENINSETITFAFDHANEGRLKYLDTPVRTTALVTLDGHLYINIRLVGEYTGSIRMEFVFTKALARLNMAFKKIEETLYDQFNGYFSGDKEK